MKKLSKQQQTLLLIGGGGLVLVLLYRWYQNRSAAASQQGQMNPTDQAASDYANLAGQEQADINKLQGEVQGLQGPLNDEVRRLRIAWAIDQKAIAEELAGLKKAEKALGLGAGGGKKTNLNPGGGKGGKGGKGGPGNSKPNDRQKGHGLNKRPLDRITGGFKPDRIKGHKGGLKAQQQIAHMPNHQAGVAGHVGGHAGDAIAPVSMGIKPGVRHFANTGLRTVTVTHPNHAPVPNPPRRVANPPKQPRRQPPRRKAA